MAFATRSTHLAAALGGILASAACGDDAAPKLPDAVLPELDAPDTDAPPSGPSARVINHTNPNDYDRAGSRVVFYLANGSVSKVATLDDQGVAEGYVDDGGTITFIEHHLALGTTRESVEIRTIFGVAEGEEIQIGFRFPTTTSFPITVNGPTYPNAASYVVYTYCNRGSAGSPVSATPTGLTTTANGCTKADLLLEARNGSGQRMATLHGQDVDVSANATVTLSGTYVVPRQRQYTVSNVPAAVASVTILAFPHPLSSSYTQGLVPTGGSLTHTAVFPDTAPFEGSSTFTFNVAYGVDAYFRVHDAFVGDVTLDAGPQIMPIASNSSLASDLRTIAWTESSGAAATATTTSFRYFGTSREFNGTWSTLSASGATSLVLPALPAELASVGPQADDNKSAPSIELEYVEGATYAGFRQESLAAGTGLYRNAAMTRSSSYYPPEL